MLDHIEVRDIQGRILLRNLVTYPADEAHIQVPMYWTKDSKELIVLPSDIALFTGGVPIVRTIWRYSLDGGSGEEIPLYPPPLYDEYAVSPDGNWIVYAFNPHALTLDLGDAPFGVYLGNLRDGTSHMLDTNKLQSDSYSSFNWSPDSLHFIGRDSEAQGDWRTYIGNIQGKITPLGGGVVSGWIDNQHYLYSDGIVGEVGKKETALAIEFSSRPGMDYSKPSAFVFLGH